MTRLHTTRSRQDRTSSASPRGKRISIGEWGYSYDGLEATVIHTSLKTTHTCQYLAHSCNSHNMLGTGGHSSVHPSIHSWNTVVHSFTKYLRSTSTCQAPRGQCPQVCPRDRPADRPWELHGAHLQGAPFTPFCRRGAQAQTAFAPHMKDSGEKGKTKINK